MENFWEFYKNFDKSLFLDKQRNSIELDFLINQLQECTSIIDYGCGSGRLTIPLAAKGFQVLGIDSDKEEIDLGRKNNTSQNAEFICADYSKYKPESKYDSAIFIYSSFGYGNDKENIKLLQKVNHYLNSKGIIILDLLNKEWSRKTQGVRDMSEKVNLDRTNFIELFRERKLFYKDRYEKTIFRYKLNNGKKGKVSFKQMLYSPKEVTLRLEYSGFKVIDLFGAYDETKYNQNESKRLIIKAIKI